MSVPAEQKTPKTSGHLMKVARYYWPGEYLIEIADKNGWFNEAGLNVELVDTNPDYFASLGYMLEIVLAKNGLDAGDIIKAYEPAENAVDSFIQDKLDAIITWEHLVTNCIQKGKGKKLLDNANYLDVRFVRVTNQELILKIHVTSGKWRVAVCRAKRFFALQVWNSVIV